MHLARLIRIIVAIALVAIIGSGGMYMFSTIFPLSDNAWSYASCTLLIIALGLGVPYAMLKLGIHEAHRRNKDEPELTLKDIPKHQDDLGGRKPQH